MNKKELVNRILARGEHSNHSHVITGDVEIIRNDKGEILIEIGSEGAALKHILESNWLEGQEVWTKEHTDIDLSELPKQVRQGDVLLDRIAERTYKYIPQIEWNPYNDMIQKVMD